MNDDLKMNALAEFLDVEVDDISVSSYNENQFEVGSKEYLVLTEDEADEAVREYIRESAWAFNIDWILSHSKVNNVTNKIKTSMQRTQETLSEDFNELVLALIEDFDEFVQDSIEADGRGHFLAGYDGQEEEIRHDGEYLYIYRTN